jgi:hypothetical protein
LRADPTVECGSSSWDLVAWGIAVPFLALFALGVPVLFLAMLVRRRGRMRSEAMKKQLGFLYTAYRPERWWFEVFESGRKLMMTSFLVFLGQGTVLQMTVATLLSVLFLVVSLRYTPFIRESESMLHTISLGCLSTILIVGTYRQFSPAVDGAGATPWADTLADVVVATCTIIPLAAGTIAALVDARTLRDRWDKVSRTFRPTLALVPGASRVLPVT